MTQALPLDHLVVNTRFETDAAAALFARLGFTLTPQGRHAMGSVNHLIVFDHDYLELIGLPTDGGALRQEILAQPGGIDGLVYKPESADAVHAGLVQRGFPVLPLHAFTRPLELDGKRYEASFRTVRFAAETFAAGRVYYCQHLTPELVWRPEWQGHANGVRGLSRLTVVSGQPAWDAQRHAEASFGEARPLGDDAWRVQGPAFSLDIVTPAAYLARYGELACQGYGRGSFFGAITLRAGDLAALRAHVAALGTQVRSVARDGGLAVSLTAYNTLLDFEYEQPA